MKKDGKGVQVATFELQNPSVSPEQCLFVAIISKTLHDLDRITKRVKRHYDRCDQSTRFEKHLPRPVQAFLNAMDDLKHINYEIRHPWFGEICEYAGIHHDVAIRHFSKRIGPLITLDHAPYFKRARTIRTRYALLPSAN